MDCKWFDPVDHQMIAHGRNKRLKALKLEPVSGPGHKPIRCQRL